jgi:hypothetical protein
MNQLPRSGMSTDRFFMFVSTALFAYFGFFRGMTPTAGNGQFVLFFAILLWTLRIGAIGFGVAVVLSFIAPMFASLVYALFGLGTSIGLVVVAVMDIQDTTYVAAIAPFWAFLFAAWNGYGSWMSLRELMMLRRSATGSIDTPSDGHEHNSP